MALETTETMELRAMAWANRPTSPATDYMLEFYLVSIPTELASAGASKPPARWQFFRRKHAVAMQPSA